MLHGKEVLMLLGLERTEEFSGWVIQMQDN